MPAAPRARPTVDPADHLVWARAIARGVRDRAHFASGSQEEAELESVAYLAVVELARAFDPPDPCAPGFDAVGAFRGWAAIEVRSRCKREAVRLWAGGTIRVAVRPDAPRPKCQNCSDVFALDVTLDEDQEPHELTEDEARTRIDQRDQKVRGLPRSARPLLEGEDEVWSVYDTTPEE